MKKFLTLFVSILLGACSGAHLDLNDDDASSADVAASADSSGRGEDAAPAKSGKACLNRCGDYDKAATCQCDDKCVQAGDCCGDYNKQCLLSDSKPTADAGSTSPDVAQTNCTDGDGDGYCDGAKLPGDCNDKDKAINPGAAEKCKDDGTGNGVDENCNGQVDEGCKATPTPGTATVKVTYPTSRFQQLLVHVWGGSKSYIFSGYEKVVNATASVFEATVPVDSNACGLAIQAANGSSPATSSFWLCTGPGGPSSLDPDATVEVIYNGKTYNEAEMTMLGAPSGGCAVVVQFKTASPCNL